MAGEVMLALTTTHRPIRLEMDDVRDMVRNATVTTIYVSSHFLKNLRYKKKKELKN